MPPDGMTMGAPALALEAGIAYAGITNGMDNWDKFQSVPGGEGGLKTGQKQNPTKGESEIWKDLDNVKGQDRKTSGTGKDKKYHEWDYTHNDIEVYNRNGRHLGSMNPTTGEMYKPAVPGRTIKIN